MKNYNNSSCDSLNLYIKDIRKYQLLSSEEEKELFIKIKAGDNKAKEMLINSNLRLVLSIAYKFVKKCNVPLLDLIEEGNIGLMIAVNSFDISKGYKFSSYATIAITTHIIEYISTKENIIKISKETNDKIKKYKTFISKFEEKNYRQPTIDEISKAMNISNKEVLKIISSDKTILSIDQNFNEENNTLFDDCLLISPENVEDIVALSSLKEQIMEVINHADLSKKELFILKMRYGINEEDTCYTLSYLAKLFNISKQAVSQIENKALNKIRKNSELLHLIDYADKPNETFKKLIKR